MAKSDPLKGYREEHKKLMIGVLAPSTSKMHLAVLDLLAAQVGQARRMDQATPPDIERLRAGRQAAAPERCPYIFMARRLGSEL